MEQLQQQIQELTGALNALVLQNQNREQEIAQLRQQLHNNPGRNNDLFKIPDPIKSIPIFSGNKRELHTWLRTAERTLNLFRPVANDQQLTLYLQAILNKIEGKAREIVCLAGEIQNFEELRTILTESLGDRQELSTYKSQLWQNKMSNDISIHKYYAKTKEIVQCIKTLSKQKVLFNEHWEAIEAFINEDALAAFISGLRKPYFGYAQASKPKDIEEAYAFLCKYTSNERTAQGMVNQKKEPKLGSSKPAFKADLDKKSPRPEPMEIDPSLRSRMTFNKKLINNHECTKAKEDEEEIREEPENSYHESDDDEDELTVNFWMAKEAHQKT